jgi:hypothetical protein
MLALGQPVVYKSKVFLYLGVDLDVPYDGYGRTNLLGKDGKIKSVRSFTSKNMKKRVWTYTNIRNADENPVYAVFEFGTVFLGIIREFPTEYLHIKDEMINYIREVETMLKTGDYHVDN